MTIRTKLVLSFSLTLLLSGCAANSRPDPDTAAASNNPPAASGSSPAKKGQVQFGPDSPKLKQIKVEVVTAAEVPANTVTAPGRIDVNPNRVSHVVLPVAGRIVSVLVKLGDPVKQGQPILELVSPESDTAVASYAQAQASVAQAKAALLKANADLDRDRDLFEHKAIAQKEILNGESIVAQAKAVLEQADAAQGQALHRLELLGLKPGEYGQQLTVTAPVSGKVLEINVVPGEYRNDLSASLITIADLSSVWAVADVPETDIRFIQLNESLAVELTAYPGETFHARVARIADVLDPQTRTVKVSAELANPQGRLRPEMFGEIRHVEGTMKLPLIPAAAVLQSEGSTIVYREVSSGVFEPVPVTLGERVGDRVSIRTGISPGDRIVTEGVLLLKGN
jgi:cobalt-zinc-cadmium efflux system membrane fusion protein